MSGDKRVVRGAFVSNGASQTVNVVGFRPTVVDIYDLVTPANGHWQDTFADGTMFKRIANGTGSLVAAPNGITPVNNGFTLGVDAALNVNTHTVHFTAVN